MTPDQLIVLALLVLPLAGAVAVWILGPTRGKEIRTLSSAVSVVMLLLAAVLVTHFLALDRTTVAESSTFVPEFVPGSAEGQPHRTTWTIVPLANTGIQFFLGVDGLNVWLVALTALLMLPCVLVSYNYITDRVHEYYAWLLVLQTAMIGVFLAFDIILFYVFFELTLVPLFFLIGIWGGSQRQYAANKFFLYTLFGSLITLLGVLGIVLTLYSRTQILTFSLPDLLTLLDAQLGLADADSRAFWHTIQVWCFLAMSVGFAVKVPLLPFHTWLPLAHTEAPTAGSVVLAGVLLKVGAYGFLRLCISLTPDASLAVGLPLITWLGAIGVIYGSFCAFAQDDVKKLIAYSSVSHLGLVMLGMFSLTATGIQGSLIEMINHGLSTPLLFLLIGMLYERYHTRMIKDYGGMARRLPLFATLLIFSAFSSVGLPGLNGFVGEFLCLAGIYQQESGAGHAILPILTTLGTCGMVLGAWYLFTAFHRILFGPTHEPHHEGESHVHDLSPREWGSLVPMVILCVVIGLYPAPILNSSANDVERVTMRANKARERAGAKPVPMAVAEK
jgi:NADH-quinone oxidoreductase subunit M